MPLPRRLPTAAVVATFALCAVVAGSGAVAVAVGVGDGDDAACPHVDAAKPAGGLLDCLGPSTAYVSTPIGSGSGLVIEGGYVLTNAHVVDPFAEVDLTLGEQELEGVKVVGVDLVKDIAVLGPIETDAPAVHLVDPSHLRTGDDLFLVGYPGEANTEDLEATVAKGILSRTRHSKQFGLSYLQTDASIGGGQSGGALVDRDGDVVGISSLRFADSFALALSGKDAQSAVDDILAGKGDDYDAFPGGELTQHASFHLSADDEPGVFAIPAAPEARTVDITFPSNLPILAFSTSLEADDDLQMAASLHAIAAEELGVPLAAVQGATKEQLTQYLDDDVDLADDVSDGTYRFELPAGQHVLFVFVSDRDAPLDVPVASTVAGAEVKPTPVQDVEVGDHVDATVTTLVPYDTYRIALKKGDRIRLQASSPSGDMDATVYGPGLPDDGKDYDDSRAGLYGVDVDEVFEAPADGSYTIEVGQVSESATGYHFAVGTPEPGAAPS